MSNGREDARDSSLIRSVDRAVAILDLLAAQGWQAGAEVARELHVHRSTALRLLATLERHGLVERDSRTAKYRLGRRLVQLASAVRGEADVRQAARPVCEALARALGETVTLDVLDGHEIVPIEQATGSTSVVSVNWLGTRSPAHCTASGKVILAFAPEPTRAPILQGRLQRRTANTIVDRAELEAVAAPVWSATGEVIAALDVSGPAHRLAADERPELVKQTREAAEELSRRLGYRPRADTRHSTEA